METRVSHYREGNTYVTKTETKTGYEEKTYPTLVS